MKKITLLLMVLSMFACAHAQHSYDVETAIETLKDCWRDEVFAFVPEGSEGYFEIKNTRLVQIKDSLPPDDENALEIFGDVDCIVEFVIYSDELGSAPYYPQAENWRCVLIYEDGTMETVMRHPFEEYRARTYSLDLSGIIQNVIDLNQEYNAVYLLGKE